MNAPAGLAAAAELLAPAPRTRWWARWWPFRRRGNRGLEGIPERYRLQFILLAAEKFPRGASPADVTALADRLAATVKIPPALVEELDRDTKPLDAWFKNQAERIVAELDRLAA